MKNNILKWIGSKTQAVNKVLEIIKDKNFYNCYELYSGSAVLSIELNKVKQFNESYAIDIDENLIKFYNYLKTNDKDLKIKYENYHNSLLLDNKFYYHIRKIFNDTHESHDYFFLNRTCISGLMRYNKGKFNSPLHPNRTGSKPKLINKIIDQNLDIIKKINFINDDVEEFCDKLNVDIIKNSLFILDPPYSLTGENSLYVKGSDTEKLLRLLKYINDNGGKIILFYGSKQFDDQSNLILNNLDMKTIELDIGKSNPGSFFRKTKANNSVKIIELMYINF